jgi:hypothetical protein
VAASPHGDTPQFGKPVTSGSATPYTTSVDVNFGANIRFCRWESDEISYPLHQYCDSRERLSHDQLHRAGIIEAMSKSSSRRFPVTVTQLPVTRCQICRRTVAYRPGSLTQILTEHYRRVHPEALSLPSR